MALLYGPWSSASVVWVVWPLFRGSGVDVSAKGYTSRIIECWFYEQYVPRRPLCTRSRLRAKIPSALPQRLWGTWRNKRGCHHRCETPRRPRKPAPFFCRTSFRSTDHRPLRPWTPLRASFTPIGGTIAWWDLVEGLKATRVMVARTKFGYGLNDLLQKLAHRMPEG